MSDSRQLSISELLKRLDKSALWACTFDNGAGFYKYLNVSTGAIISIWSENEKIERVTHTT